MPSVALVTYLGSPELSESDARLAAALADRGCFVRPIPWDAETDRVRFDAVVIRSTWDYHHRPTEFAAWVERMGTTGTHLWNRPEVVRWNMHKSYLLDLESAGIAVVPTAVAYRGSSEPLGAIAAGHGWSRIVVKPAIGASAQGVVALDGDQIGAFQDSFTGQLETTDVLIQPLLAEVAVGEWSLVYFGGAFSHAALKVPASGDIRVQQRYGGTASVVAPADELVRQGRKVLDAAASIHGCDTGALLYARVDGLCIDGQFILMELELIEPGLFLHMRGAEHAASRFAEAIVRTT